MIASIVPLLGVAITVIVPNATASAKPFAVSFATCFAVMSQLFPASRAYLDNVVSSCNKAVNKPSSSSYVSGSYDINLVAL